MRTSIFILISLLLAFMFDVILVYLNIVDFKPFFFLLTLIYWNLALPERISLFSVIIFGLIYDLFQGTLLGVFGIAFLSITYIFQRFFYQFRTLSILQQILLVFIIAFFLKLYLAINFENTALFSSALIDKNYIGKAALNALINALIWPFVFFTLRAFRRKWIGLRR